MKLVFAIMVIFNNGIPTDWDIVGTMTTMERCQAAAHDVFEKDRSMVPEGMQAQIKCVDFEPIPLIDSAFGPKRVLKPAPSEKSSER